MLFYVFCKKTKKLADYCCGKLKLVAEEFCTKEKESQKFVIHLDQDNLSTHYQNLQWMTQREMTDFQIKNGVYDPKNRKPSPFFK